MDDKIFNMSEAFIKMTESFLTVVKSVKAAKFVVDNMLRLQYREAGCPFGESEEGLLLWRDKLTKDFASLQESTAFDKRPAQSSGEDFEKLLFLAEDFSSLKNEINTRTN